MAEACFDNGFTSTRIGFVVAASYPAVLAEPAEGTLHDPASGQYHEALGAGWGPDYLHAQAQHRGRQRPLVAGIGSEHLQVRRPGLGLHQHRSRADWVLHPGRLHEHS